MDGRDIGATPSVSVPDKALRRGNKWTKQGWLESDFLPTTALGMRNIFDGVGKWCFPEL
jgi:hypothetical protein